MADVEGAQLRSRGRRCIQQRDRSTPEPRLQLSPERASGRVAWDRGGRKHAVGGLRETYAANLGRDRGAGCDRDPIECVAILVGDAKNGKTMPAFRSLRPPTTGRVLLFRPHATTSTCGGVAKRSAAKISAECAGTRSRRAMSSRKPLVSVLIDTYNYGCYVEEAIDSVLMQEFPAHDREILVVDDGSMDDTAERVRKFGDAVSYFRKANGGQRRHSISGCDTRAVSMWLSWMPTIIGCRGSFHGWWTSLKSIRTRRWSITDCVNSIRAKEGFGTRRRRKSRVFSRQRRAICSVTHGFQRHFSRFGEVRWTWCCRFRRVSRSRQTLICLG